MTRRSVPGTRGTMATASHAGRAWWTLCAPLLLWALPELIRLAGAARRRRRMHALLRVWATLAGLGLGIRLRVSGLRNARAGPFVVLALHEGMADAVVLLSSLPLDLRFAARDELLGWPHVGRYLRDTRQLIAATHPSVGAGTRFLAAARNAVSRGESVVVFAQGSILGLEVALELGAAHLASRLGIPILPVMISGTHRVWEHPYGPTLRFGQSVRLTVLPPIPAPGRSRSEILDVTRRVSHELKTMAPRGGSAPVRRFDPTRDGWWDGYRYRVDPAFPALAARVAAHRASIAIRQAP